MTELILLVGNIGSGKGRLAEQYHEKGYLILNKDAIRSMIGAGKYIFDPKIEPILAHIEGALAGSMLSAGYNIVVDSCNVTIGRRMEYKQIAEMFKAKIIVHELPRELMSLCIERRMNDARGVSKETWEEVWMKFDSKYFSPIEEEGYAEIRRGADVN